MCLKKVTKVYARKKSDRAKRVTGWAFKAVSSSSWWDQSDPIEIFFPYYGLNPNAQGASVNNIMPQGRWLIAKKKRMRIWDDKKKKLVFGYICGFHLYKDYQAAARQRAIVVAVKYSGILAEGLDYGQVLIVEKIFVPKQKIVKLSRRDGRRIKLVPIKAYKGNPVSCQ